jgi:dolichyl-phosphate-mannose--protein O-mannosyl transferase
MLSAQLDTTVEHVYSSDPLEWPLMKRNIIYWFNPTNYVNVAFINSCLFTNVVLVT